MVRTKGSVRIMAVSRPTGIAILRDEKMYVLKEKSYLCTVIFNYKNKRHDHSERNIV
jgi:hypothetical protein